MTEPTTAATTETITETGIDDETLATLDRWLAYRVWHARVPGAQVAIGLRGALLFSAAYGYADLERRTPMRTDHRFRIASHSKNVTATLILQLVEQGRLGLEDRVGDHVAELTDHELGVVSIRELLEHTGGLLRDGADADFWQGSRSFPDRDQLFTLIGAHGKRPPGELFAYSNLGYGVLGAVIESVTGQPYATTAQRLILDPLGLDDTWATYRRDWAQDYATGYTGLDTAVRRQRLEHVDTRALDAATGFTSTAEDLVTYFGAHALGDLRLLPDRAKRRMQRVANVVDPERPDGPTYGLGTAGETVGESRLVGHGGGYPGHITRSLLDPDDGLVVVALTNAMDGPASALATGVAKLIQDARAHPQPRDRERPAARTGRWAAMWGVLDLGWLGSRLLAIRPEAPEPLESADVLDPDGSDGWRIGAGGGYGSVGEPVRFAADGSLRYGGMSLQRFDDLPERADALT